MNSATKFAFSFCVAVAQCLAATLGSQTVITSLTPTALACSSQRYVNKLTVRVIPGFSGKVFVGTSSMDTSTYAGTIAILYPNLGAHSEEYVVQDSSGDDGIDLCSIYVAGGVTGESIVADYVSNGNGATAPTYLFVPGFVQAVSGGSLVTMLSPSSTYWFSTVRVQVIPGYAGKQHISLTGSTNLPHKGEIATLYPNSGTLSQHNAWSELWEQTDLHGANELWVGPYTTTTVPSASYTTDLSFVPDVSGEEVLVSLWRKQTSGGAVEVPTVFWFMNTGGSTSISMAVTSPTSIGGCAGASCGTGFARDQHLRITPGYGDKVQISSGVIGAEHYYAEYGTLFPNNTGSLGWSEHMDFGPLSALAFSIGVGPLPAGGLTALDLGSGSAAIDATYLVSSSLYNGGTASGVYGTVGSINRYYSGCSPSCVSGPGVSFPAQHLEIAVSPGGSGKLFVGSCAAMNTATLVGVRAILYPNSTGRWSERLIIDDPEGDGIPAFCVTPQIPGEKYEMFTYSTGVVPADGVMSVKMEGPLSGSLSSSTVPFASSSTPIALLRAQAIPGGAGKIWVGTSAMTAAQPDSTYANVLKVLWPSQGNYDVGEGHSEQFTQACHAGPVSAPNCLDLVDFRFWPGISSEQLLVFALGR